jgi:hypothetical protein
MLAPVPRGWHILVPHANLGDFALNTAFFLVLATFMVGIPAVVLTVPLHFLPKTTVDPFLRVFVWIGPVVALCAGFFWALSSGQGMYV